MDFSIASKVFEFIVLLFALSFHEAAHAWMASRLGDPTARMLGRLTLNPIKHIDPLGTLILPLMCLFLPGFGGLLFGWAKPTPVTTRNFKNLKRDDTLTTLAGPVANILLAIASLIVLLIIARVTPTGRACVLAVSGFGLDPDLMAASPIVLPLTIIFYYGILLNLFLAIFNLLPLPPLDGSHIFRHMLPYKAAAIYDKLGIFSLIIMFVIGGRVAGFIMAPALGFFNGVLRSF
jgi:Zn-dependent protease